MASATARAGEAALSTASAPGVSPGIVILWTGTGLACAALLVMLALGPRWLARLSLRDRVVVALTSSLALLGITLPAVPVLAFSTAVLGPFAFIPGDLFFKLELFVIIGALVAWVPRPGVYTLFYLLWMAGQALLSGYLSYGPIILLFAGIAVMVVEAAWWAIGLTRGRDVPVLWAAAVLGVAEAAIVYWDVHLLQAYFRFDLPEGLVLAQAASGGLSSALGFAFGLPLGRKLRVVQRPDLPLEPSRASVSATNSARFAAGSEARLDVSGLSVRYPNMPASAVENVTFSLAPGEIVLLTGPTGCGKSTVLRAIQGLLPSATGTIRLGGVDRAAFGQAAWARACALLMQEPELQLLRLTPAGEVRLALDMVRSGTRKTDAPDAEATDTDVRTALAPLGLEALADRSFDRLSGGERLRAVLAALLAGRPRLLLLDEPLAHLDATHRLRLLALLQDLARSGVAVLVADHRVAELLPAMQRVLWMEAGRIVQQRTASEFTLPLRAETNPAPGSRPATTSATPPALSLDGVAWRHRGVPANLFGPLSAHAPQGSAILLSGPNGAGKTTLLELLAGLRTPTSGRVHIGAADLGRRERARSIGLLPQRPDALLCARTVADELALPLRARRVPPAESAAAVADWLGRLDLGAHASRFPHLLSRGERQRLALGTVLIAAPRLLLLDEPFAGQDATQCEKLGALCQAFVAEDARRVLVLATHDLEPALPWVHARWHLEGGRLLANDAAGMAVPEDAARLSDAAPTNAGAERPRRAAGGAP